MKRTLAILAALSAMILGFALGAQAEQAAAVIITIPFAFQAGNLTMPAGDYRFEFPRESNAATGAVVRITSQDGSLCQHLLSRPTLGVTADTDWHVTFNKYSDTYFLSKVRNSDAGAELSRTRQEKQMAVEHLMSLKPVATVDLKATHTRAK